LLFAIASAALLSAAPAAQANRNLSIASIAPPPPMNVGDQGSRDIKMTNVSDAMETYTVNPAWIQPSCGSTPDPCADPDVGVFSVASVTGIDGACNGDSFTVTHDDTRDLGAFKITPMTDRVLAVNDFCTYRFTFNVLRLPTVDSDPVTAGLQTKQRIFVSPAEHPTTISSVTIGDVTVNPCSDHCPVVTPPPTPTPAIPTPPVTKKKKCKKKHHRAAAARKCKRKR
jgi:hypothetical protein